MTLCLKLNPVNAVIYPETYAILCTNMMQGGISSFPMKRYY